jgi:Flp pilus assembly protein TadG
MEMRKRFELLRDTEGASLIELAFIVPLFMLMLLGALDFGRALYLTMEIAGAAHAAASYGSQNPNDTTGMQNAAQDDAPNVPNLSVTNVSYGTVCSDGSSYTANTQTMPSSCSSTATGVYRVNVTVMGTYSPLFPWPKIPSSMSFSSSASMRSGG